MPQVSLYIDKFLTSVALDSTGKSTLRSALGAASSAVTVTAEGLATGGGDISANRTITVTASPRADHWEGTDNTKAMTAASSPIRYSENNYTLYPNIPGIGAGASSFRTTALGYVGALPTYDDCTAFGYGTTLSGSHCSTFGSYSYAGAMRASAFGYGAMAVMDETTAIGCSAEAYYSYGTAIGADATAYGAKTVAVGYGAFGYGYGVSVGADSEAGDYGVAFGYSARSASYSMAIGRYAYAAGYNRVEIAMSGDYSYDPTIRLSGQQNGVWQQTYGYYPTDTPSSSGASNFANYDNELPIGMMSITVSGAGDSILMFANVGGTLKKATIPISSF